MIQIYSNLLAVIAQELQEADEKNEDFGARDQFVGQIWVCDQSCQQNFQSRRRTMSNLKASRTAAEIDSHLSQTYRQMEEYTRIGNYVEAQNSRLLSEQLKKDLQARKVYEMERRQQAEMRDLKHAEEDELKNFNLFWDKKIEEYNNEGDRLVKEMETNHRNEQDNMRKDLEAQLPYKVKESSQCLNLRKMEEHMVKQKNYAEAHLVQTRISEMVKVEKEKWLSNRNSKIETALSTLRGNQDVELAALKKKIKTGLDEQNKDRKKEEERIMLKYGNIERELSSTHEKEVLAYKGQFTSKGGQGSPLLTKTKLFNSSRD